MMQCAHQAFHLYVSYYRVSLVIEESITHVIILFSGASQS